MNDAHRVSLGEHVEEVIADTHDLRPGHRSTITSTPLEGVPFEQLHDEVDESLTGHVIVEDRHRSGVADAVGDVAFAKEARAKIVIATMGMEDLDGAALAVAMRRGVHRGAAADAEQPIECPLPVKQSPNAFLGELSRTSGVQTPIQKLSCVLACSDGLVLFAVFRASFPFRFSVFFSFLSFSLPLLASSCQGTSPPGTSGVARDPILVGAASSAPPKLPKGARYGEQQYIAKLQRDARAIAPLVTTPFALDFLEATGSLPSKSARRVYRNKAKKVTIVQGELDALSPDERRGWEAVEVDEERYYEADVADPLHYVRPLDIAAKRGVYLGPRTKMLDFGYGAIGHLRLLASLGLRVTGVDVRSELTVYYDRPEDTGPILPAKGKNDVGELRLLHGFFPTDPKIKEQVGTGYGFVIAKNTLKKGYIHPDREVPDNAMLIQLGVDDATFLAAFHDALTPNGRMLIYNLFVPVADGQPFKPMSDGRSPFTRDQWQAAGFEIEAFDQDDSPAMQRILKATGTEEDESFRIADLHVLYTLVRRRD